MKLLLLLAALALALAPHLRADEQPVHKALQQQAEEDLLTASDDTDDTDEDVVRQILVEVQIIALPIEDALPLIEPLRDDKRIEKAVTKLHQMIANKKAKLVGWPMVITKSGNRAVVECIDELRYDLEYVLSPDPHAALEKSWLDNMNKAVSTAGSFPFNPTTPTLLEVRNVGVTFEVEPVIDPEGTHIDMQLSPQHCSVTRIDKIPTVVGGKFFNFMQPILHTNKVMTTLTLRDGQSILLGTFNTTKPEGWMELFILKASILVTK